MWAVDTGLKILNNRLTWQWRWAGEDMRAMADDRWLRLRMVVVEVCREVPVSLLATLTKRAMYIDRCLHRGHNKQPNY
jgi:hypothetical protein